GGAHRLDDPDDLMARPVGQPDKGVAPVRGVQDGSAQAGHEGAKQSFVRTGGGNVRCLDSDLAWVNDDASHAGQGDFLSRPAGSRSAIDDVAQRSRSARVLRTPCSRMEVMIEVYTRVNLENRSISSRA